MQTIPNDADLLNFLSDMGESNGLKWVARPSSMGRGWRLHQDRDGEFDTPRQAIADAMQKYGSPLRES